MPPRLSAVNRREQLLAVALSTFARAGYHETSMNDVADAAGVTKPVLYQHFESKRDLYQALLDDVGHRLVTAVTSATADAETVGSAPSAGSRATSTGSPRPRGVPAAVRWRLAPGPGVRRRGAPGHRKAADAIAPLIAADIDDEHRLDARPRARRPGRGRQPAARRARRARSTPTRSPARSAPRLGRPPPRSRRATATAGD